MMKFILLPLILAYNTIAIGQVEMKKTDLPELEGKNMHFNLVDVLDSTACFFVLSLKDKFKDVDVKKLALGSEISKSKNGYRLFSVSSKKTLRNFKTKKLKDLKVYGEKGELLESIEDFDIQCLIRDSGETMFVAVFKMSSIEFAKSARFLTGNVDVELPAIELTPLNQPRLLKEVVIKRNLEITIIKMGEMEFEFPCPSYNYNGEKYALVMATDSAEVETSFIIDLNSEEVIIETTFGEEGQIFGVRPLPCLYGGKQLFLVQFNLMNKAQQTETRVVFFDGSSYGFSEGGSWLN